LHPGGSGNPDRPDVYTARWIGFQRTRYVWRVGRRPGHCDSPALRPLRGAAPPEPQAYSQIFF
jgi:hypothetical protein